MPIPAAVLAAAPVIAGGISYLGGRSSNKANREEAKRNRGFQERMRNTEWQAAVEDMRKAGVNPAVAYSQGGASSPSGSVAAKQENAAGDAVGTALATKTAQEQFALLRAQRSNVDEQTKKTRAEARSAGLQADRDTANYMYYFDDEGRAKKPLLDLLDSQHAGSMATNARGVSEAALARLGINEATSMSDLFERIGEGGAGARALMPILLQLLRNRGGR